MISGLYSHPSVVQWTAFNEGGTLLFSPLTRIQLTPPSLDMVSYFNVPEIIEMIEGLDSTRLIDTDSGQPTP